jgi:hypothetical protein
LRLCLHVVGVRAAANRGPGRAARIPAAHLEPGCGRCGLRYARSLSQARLFPGVAIQEPKPESRDSPPGLERDFLLRHRQNS